MFGLSKAEKAAKWVSRLMASPVSARGATGYDVSDKESRFKAVVWMDENSCVINLPDDNHTSTYIFSAVYEIQLSAGFASQTFLCTNGFKITKCCDLANDLMSIQIVMPNGTHFAFNFWFDFKSFK